MSLNIAKNNNSRPSTIMRLIEATMIREGQCSEIRTFPRSSASIIKWEETQKTTFSTSQHTKPCHYCQHGSHWDSFMLFVSGCIRCIKKSQHPHLLHCNLHYALGIPYSFLFHPSSTPETVFFHQTCHQCMIFIIYFIRI